LAPADRITLMDIVAATEATLIAELHPAKMNIAALGTVVPHLHWHIVPRFQDDPAYPSPVWNMPPSASDPAADDDVLARIGKRLETLVRRG
jgi:diadenosine tetraphosphate (Ap4A) HIT family hydrolase